MPKRRISSTARKSLRFESLEDRRLFAGLVSWWTGNNTAADAVGTNHGTLINGATYAPGKVGQAFRLDGVNDRIQVVDAANLKLTKSMTIEAWLRVDSIPLTQGHSAIFSRGDDRFFLDPYNLTVFGNGEINFTVISANEDFDRVSTQAPLRQFFHIAVTLDDTTGAMRLYINGVVKAQAVTSVRPYRDLDPARNPSIRIGNHGSADYPFHGLIDELKVYDVALSEAEVLANYNATSGNPPPSISISDATANEGSTATKFLGEFVSPGSGGLDWPADMTLGPTGDVFVSSQLTNSVLRFERGTGRFIGAFVQPGSGGLNQPHGVAFGPDGNLYVASIGTNSVLAYNGSTGTFIKEFVTSQSAGLTIPKDITFGPDGNLYVPSRETDQILRFQGPGGASPGSSMGVFASTGSGSTPNHLAFGPDGNLYVGLPSYNTPTPFDAKIARFNGSTGAFIDTFVPLGSGGIGDTREIIFDTSGNLYVADVSKEAVLRYQGPNGQAPGAFIDAFVPSGLGGLAKPIGIVFDADKNLLVAAREADSVLRYGPSSQAAFTVSLSAPSGVPVTVNYATTPGTAGASDFTTTTGTLTFAPLQTSRTILVKMLDDAIFEANETFLINLSNPIGATIADGQGIGTIFDNDTKFYVVDDGSQNRTYEYGASGQAGEVSNLASGNSAPRGAATTAAGDTVWVVDANRNVYVYNNSGGLLGSWTARTLPSNATPEGIATNGTDVWIVDGRDDRVYRYAGAASRTSGSQFAASSFPLNSGNTSPKDIVTDGQHLWVVNDSSTDRVFKYTIAGALVGSWTIDSANKNPTGITVDPANAQHIWIVDSGTDRVYQYAGAASRTSGSQTAASSFALATGNTNPQGIADPPTAAAISVATSQEEIMSAAAYFTDLGQGRPASTRLRSAWRPPISMPLSNVQNSLLSTASRFHSQVASISIADTAALVVGEYDEERDTTASLETAFAEWDSNG